MITLRKLESLPPGTRRRKIVRLIEGWERSGEVPDSPYLIGMIDLVRTDAKLPEAVREAATHIATAVRTARADPDGLLRRALNDLRHLLARELGMAPGDWDLLEPAAFTGTGGRESMSHTDTSSRGATALAGVALYLESIRSPFNAGSILRTAAAFGVRYVGMDDGCPPIDHPRLVRSAMGAAALVQTIRGPLDLLIETAYGDAVAGDDGSDGPPVYALELGGEPVDRVSFPRLGILILGSEELGISPALLERADRRVTIPLGGGKASLNVGVACGIGLAAWQAARARADGSA